MGFFDHLDPSKNSEAAPSRPYAVPDQLPDGVTPYAAAALRSEADQVAATPDGQRNDALNRAWFRMGRHVGAGGIDVDTVRTTLRQAGLAAGLPAIEVDKVLRDDTTSALTAGAHHPRTPDPTRTPAGAPGATPLHPGSPAEQDTSGLDAELEEWFWTARPLHRHLRDFARARRVSPWAVLGVTLARIITAVPHAVCLPPIVGGRASLNTFIGLVGTSGSGKGAAEAVAADAVSVGYLVTHNVGSGEGIAHGYKRRVKNELEWIDDDHAVLFSVPEIDSLAAQGGRQGATLLPQLRSAWSGEQLGFGYADPTRRIIVEAHQYRLALVAGIQPARAGALLDDADGGTPQRFLWLPATDPDAPDQPPDEPDGWAWHMPLLGAQVVGIGGVRLQVCDKARQTIVDARPARLRGQGEALDGHTLLAWLKTAAAVALADAGTNPDRHRDDALTVTDDDWDLAGAIMARSAHTRAAVVDTLKAANIERNTERAEAEARRAVLVEERTTDAAVRRVCRVVQRKLQHAPAGDSGGPGGLVASDVRKAITSRDRQHLDTALERLLEAGQIVVEGEGRGLRYRAAGSPS